MMTTAAARTANMAMTIKSSTKVNEDMEDLLRNIIEL
jgi:hypothetical protein